MGSGKLHTLDELLAGVWLGEVAMPDFMFKLTGGAATLDAAAPGLGGEHISNPGTFQQRKANALEAKINAMTTKVQARQEERVRLQREAGLFPCGAKCPHTGFPCAYIYSTESGLRKHQARTSGPEGAAAAAAGTPHQATVRGRGKGPLGSVGTLVQMASEPGIGVVARGRRSDRSLAAPAPDISLAAAGPATDIAAVAGQFYDPPRAKNYYKTPKQLEELKQWFDDGMADKKKKVSPELANERMRQRLCVSSGRRFYSFRKDFCRSCADLLPGQPDPERYARRCATEASGRENGIVLPVATIRSHFSGLTSAGKKKGANRAHNINLANQMALGVGHFAPQAPAAGT